MKFERSCDTDHHLVVAKVRERLAVSKRPANKSDRITKQYQIEISDIFSASGNLRNKEDINRAREIIEYQNLS
jgi:hypothetical protein